MGRKTEEDDVERDDLLVPFLYLLVRDELPLGRVEELIDEASRKGKRRVKFTQPHLLGWASGAADRLEPNA